jgi:hypothetical protein
MDTPTGRVVPLEKVYGFSTRRLEPTDKVKGRKGGKGEVTLTKRMNPSRFLEERIKFPHFHNCRLFPALLRDERFDFLAEFRVVFCMHC